MSTPIRVLILEKEPDQAMSMIHHLREAGLEPEWLRVYTKADYLAQLPNGWDMILAGYSLVGFDAPQALRLLQEQSLDIPFIVVTSGVGESAAVRALVPARRPGTAGCSGSVRRHRA